MRSYDLTTKQQIIVRYFATAKGAKALSTKSTGYIRAMQARTRRLASLAQHDNLDLEGALDFADTHRMCVRLFAQLSQVLTYCEGLLTLRAEAHAEALELDARISEAMEADNWLACCAVLDYEERIPQHLVW